MKNGDMPILPMGGIVERAENGAPQIVETHGLTKREHFAGLAMSGLLASDATFCNAQAMASEAIACADALLAELEKSQ